MKIRRFSLISRFACGVCLLAVLPACSLFHRHPTEANASAQPNERKVGRHSNSRGLDLEIKVSPDPVKLGEVREIGVGITLRNSSKQPTTLKFPTNQILEIALRDVATGAIVSKWSTDRTFAPDGRILSINRDERLEYNETITTRELKAGRPYNVEVSFLGHENELSTKKVLIPQP